MIFADEVGPILAEFEGCPEILAVDALRNACIDFCKATYGWHTGVKVMSDATASGLINNEFQVLDIVDARIPGKTVCVTFANADDDDIDATAVDHTIRLLDPNVFDIDPAPSTPLEIELFVILAPKPKATVFSDQLWDEWHEALRNGAIGRLHKGGGTWAAPNKAASYLNDFEAEKKAASIKYARNRRNRGRVLRVKPA